MDQGEVRTSDLEDKGKKFGQSNKDKDKIRKWWQRNTKQHIKTDPLQYNQIIQLKPNKA